VGYSKLAKAALLRKLGELHSLATSTSPQSAQPQTQADNLLSKAGSSSSQVDDSPSLAVRRPGSMGPPSLPSHGPVSDTPVPCTHIPPSSATLVSVSATPPSRPFEGPGKCLPSSAPNAPVSKKRVSPEMSAFLGQTQPSAKKRKVAVAAVRLSNSTTLPDDRDIPRPSLSALPGSALVPGVREAGGQAEGRTQTVDTPGKRFKPLRVTRPPPETPGNRTEAPLSSGLHVNESISVIVQPIPLLHLDFPTHRELPLLSHITIPPPLSQRRLIERWAIILSGLSGKELLQSCLVSKLIRYAGKHRSPGHVEYIHIHLKQSIHPPIISSVETFLGDVYLLYCNSAAQHP